MARFVCECPQSAIHTRHNLVKLHFRKQPLADLFLKFYLNLIGLISGVPTMACLETCFEMVKATLPCSAPEMGSNANAFAFKCILNTFEKYLHLKSIYICI